MIINCLIHSSRQMLKLLHQRIIEDNLEVAPPYFFRRVVGYLGDVVAKQMIFFFFLVKKNVIKCVKSIYLPYL